MKLLAQKQTAQKHIFDVYLGEERLCLDLLGVRLDSKGTFHLLIVWVVNKVGMVDCVLVVNEIKILPK